MILKIQVHVAAELELQDAVSFYEIECPGLGREFLEAFRQTAQSLAKFPKAAPLVTSTIRKKPMERFPFALLYAIEHDEVRIFAVAHQKRRPFYWNLRQF